MKTEQVICVVKYSTFVVDLTGEVDRKMSVEKSISLMLQAKFDRLETSITCNQKRIVALEKQLESYEKAKKYKKEFYNVKDLVELCGRGAEQVRRYLKRGLIKGVHRKNSWIVSAEEFERVKVIVETKGVDLPP
ncbi:helix-turn-helix domain-containing protein [bacterium]|nr:helix-turn-helix domain-containing protein [bacterium]